MGRESIRENKEIQIVDIQFAKRNTGDLRIIQNYGKLKKDHKNVHHRLDIIKDLDELSKKQLREKVRSEDI